MNKLDPVIMLRALVNDIEFAHSVQASLSGVRYIHESVTVTFNRIMEEYKAAKYHGVSIPDAKQDEKPVLIEAWALIAKDIDDRAYNCLYACASDAGKSAELLRIEFPNFGYTPAKAMGVERLSFGRALWDNRVFEFYDEKDEDIKKEVRAQEALDKISEEDKELMNLPDDAGDLLALTRELG